MAGLLTGVQCLTSNAAVDYTKPFNKRTYATRIIPLSSQFTTENDWKQYSRIHEYDPDTVGTSYTISCGATDNYGEDFDIWISVYVYGGTRDGRILYDSGWKSGIINRDSFINNTNDSFRVVMRVRYALDSGHYNPPVNNVWTGGYYQVEYEKYFNYDVLPDSWTAETTASTISFPEPVFTTSTYIDWDAQVTGENGIFNSIKYLISTTFGITDSWQDLVIIMNYMNGKLPYVYAITFFCGVTGIAVWFLEK